MPVVAEFFELTSRNWRARLAISVDVMRELSRYSDPDEMYHIFARRMNQLYPTTRQLSISRRGLESPSFRVTRYNLWKEQVNPYRELHRLPVFEGGLLAELLYCNEPRVIDEIDLAPDDPANEFLDGQRSLLAIPLYENGVAVNTLIVTRDESHAFPWEQVPELIWMTNLFARAMQTLVLSDQLKEAYQNADYELRVIADLQHSLLPAEVPQIAGLDMAVHYRTANRAGGDYYDFFLLPNNKLGVLIADVSGHGSPAAVLMAITHSLAHSYPEPPTNPGKFLGYLNTSLARRYVGTTGHFVTAFYAVFDVKNREMTYANAGHLAPRLAVSEVEGWRPLSSHQRLPLGVNARQSVYPEHVVAFGPGDKVALFTDGIIEVVDQDDEPFGFERLDRSWNPPAATAEQIIDRVLREVDRFTNGVPLVDDRTLVVIGHV